MEKIALPKIEVSIKTILTGIVVVVLLKFAWDMKDVLFSLFIAYIIMSVAKQPVEALAKKGVSKGLAVLSIFLLFFLCIV